MGAQAHVLLRKLAQADQILDLGDELLVVPRLGDVVGGALFDELHGGLERRERRHDEHRQIGVEAFDIGEQLGPLRAVGGVAPEVHVLHDGSDVFRSDDGQRPRRGRWR